MYGLSWGSLFNWPGTIRGVRACVVCGVCVCGLVKSWLLSVMSHCDYRVLALHLKPAMISLWNETLQNQSPVKHVDVFTFKSPAIKLTSILVLKLIRFWYQLILWSSSLWDLEKWWEREPVPTHPGSESCPCFACFIQARAQNQQTEIVWAHPKIRKAKINKGFVFLLGKITNHSQPVS